MSSAENYHVKKRSAQACQNCRRKKTRCPGEKPACSSCTRLNQMCNYVTITKSPQQGLPWADRIATIEEKLDLILSGSSNENAASRIGVSGGTAEGSDVSPSLGANTADDMEPSMLPRTEMIMRAISLYFEHCHRQPIWCFDHADLENHATIPEELICSILALTSHFLPPTEQVQQYNSTARSLIMLRIADGTVSVATLEGLCLLSFSFFMDGETALGRFHLGLALQLVRAAMLDVCATYSETDPYFERKKRLFWSLQTLNNYYGHHAGLFTTLHEISCLIYRSSLDDSVAQKPPDARPPPLPVDEIKGSSSIVPGIWVFSVPVGWIWEQVRTYVVDCENNRLKMPWLHDSAYAIICSNLIQVENQLPTCHRYDSVKFYESQASQVQLNRAYWHAWLRVQFAWHTSHVLLNHPFLYISAAPKNPGLNNVNTFWRRSTELALVHATWIVRMLDMVSEKELRLTDPFFAHSAAIAASVHLFYSCAANSRLKLQSTTELVKCRKFLKTLGACSRACAALDEKLERLVQVGQGSVDDYSGIASPSIVRLSNHLMWGVLHFECNSELEKTQSSSLFDSSLQAVVPSNRNSPPVEVRVSTPPEVTISTFDGGQAARTGSRTADSSVANDISNQWAWGSSTGMAAPDFMLGDDTSVFWVDEAPNMHLDHLSRSMMDPDVGELGGASWWEFGQL